MTRSHTLLTIQNQCRSRVQHQTEILRRRTQPTQKTGRNVNRNELSRRGDRNRIHSRTLRRLRIVSNPALRPCGRHIRHLYSARRPNLPHPQHQVYASTRRRKHPRRERRCIKTNICTRPPTHRQKRRRAKIQVRKCTVYMGVRRNRQFVGPRHRRQTQRCS